MKYLEGLLFSIRTFLAPIKGLVILVMMMVLFDTIVGIYASVKRGDTFRSSRLFNLVVKTFFYTGSIMLAFLIDKYIFGAKLMGVDFMMSKIACILWTYIEIKSLDEKSVMLGNRPLWTIIKEFVKKAKSIKDDIKKIIE